MKNTSKIALALVVITITAVSLLAQTDKRVTEIRAHVAAINSTSSKYKKKTKDVFGISTEGAGVTYYRSGKELTKIVAKIYGETYNAVSEFYFSGGSLIFCYDRINHYDRSIGVKSRVKVVRIEQIRSYFAGGKQFKMLNGTKTIDPSSDDFTENEKRNLESLKEILDAENREQ